MKTILLLAGLCFAAHAAPLPPLPPPPVKRPAPLLSPSHAAAAKTAPMVKATFRAASYQAAPMRCTMAKDINFLGCDTNNPTCRLYDLTTISAQQKAGVKITLEFADSPNPSEWAWVAVFEACPTARVVETTWIQPDDQRPGCRFFRARETRPDVAQLLSGPTPVAGSFRLNPKFYGLKATSVPRK